MKSIKCTTLLSIEQISVKIIRFSWNLEISGREDICEVHGEVATLRDDSLRAGILTTTLYEMKQSCKI